MYWIDVRINVYKGHQEISGVKCHDIEELHTTVKVTNLGVVPNSTMYLVYEFDSLDIFQNPSNGMTHIPVTIHIQKD